MTHLHKFCFVVLTLLVLAPVATAVNAQTPPRKRAAQKSAGATVLFSPASGSPVTVGVTPSAIATADLNRDGSADFLAANKTGNSVSVRLGNSSGFTAASDVPVGTPVDIATGDVNQDGKLDFLVLGQSAAKVFVWLGDGAGAFTAGDSILIGLQPVSLALGDFNGDGKTDVIVLRSAGDFFVRLGDGAGGFPTSSSFGTGFPNASDITAADFDNDGDLDLFIVNTSNTLITIARNDGGSGFASQTNFQIGVGTNPNVVAAADINNDGAQDFLTVNTGNNTVAVFLGDATGGFLYGEVIPVGPGASDIKLADFNGDGNLDFLTANAGDNSATLGLGDGTGGFTTQPLTAGIAGQPDRLAVADVNNDGKLDFFINSPETNAVAVLQNGIVFDVTTFT
ncbi:MAG: VCBS repeat-containing protein, partial [Rhizobacter sp.]|nr:VCBS repeat-containing protein [Chlorobiales bacterium]